MCGCICVYVGVCGSTDKSNICRNSKNNSLNSLNQMKPERRKEVFFQSPVCVTLLLFLLSSGMTTWRCEMVWMRAVSLWGSTAGRSLPLRSSPLETSSSSSLFLTMRRTAQVSPSDTRSSRQVGVLTPL